MSTYWVEFTGRGPGCVETKPGEDIMTVAREATGCEPTRADVLAYPAAPRLRVVDAGMPSFCFQPQQCRGSSRCLAHRACND